MNVIPIARVSCLNSSNDYKVAYEELLGQLRERGGNLILYRIAATLRGERLCVRKSGNMLLSLM